MSKAEQNINKIVLNLSKVSATIFLVSIVLIIIYSFFLTPGEKKARSLVRSTFHYLPPASTKLILSRNYWASFDSREPRSICLIFQYYDQDFIDFNNIDFSIKNRDDAHYLSSPIINNKGCAKSIAGSKHFKKHFKYFRRLEGGTIFVDMKNKIVIYEIYMFD